MYYCYYAVINCIPSPYYLGNSRDLAGTCSGIYRKLCPGRPVTNPGLMWGDISVRAGNVQPCLHMPGLDSDQRHPVLWRGNLPMDLQEKCLPAVLGSTRAVPWISHKYKIESRASLRYPQVVGGGRVTFDGCISYVQMCMSSCDWIIIHMNCVFLQYANF